MSNVNSPDPNVPERQPARMDDGRFLLAMGGLLAVTTAVLLVVTMNAPPRAPDLLVCVALFLFSLFTISCQYQHPGQGVVSFDRVAQFSAVLLLDPISAAWINAAASFVHPFERLRRGIALPRTLAASCANASMMGLAVLAGGLSYQALGGSFPLQHLDATVLAPLLGMALVAHVVNEGVLEVVLRIRQPDHRYHFDGYSMALEWLSFVVAAVFAVIWSNLTLVDCLLSSAILCIGMRQLGTHGQMRIRLERLVDERTRDLQAKSQMLDEMTRTDALTGLRNRRHAQIRLDEEIHRARRHHRPFCVALADLDYFKQINDRYSHAAGDDALCRVAAEFEKTIRGEDMVARYGGEEFIFLFPEITLEDAHLACERLRQAVQEIRLPDIALSLRLTVSIGVAEYRDQSAAQLLSEVDRALYAAKNRGRDQVLAVPNDGSASPRQPEPN